MKTLKFFLFAFATLLISCGDKALIVTEDVKPTLPAQPYDYDNYLSGLHLQDLLSINSNL